MIQQFSTLAILTLSLLCYGTAAPQQQKGQIIKETITDDIITYPDGSRREEIIDDEIIARPDGAIEEIKTDQISTSRGSGSYPSSQGSFGSGSYGSSQWRTGSYNPSGTNTYGK